MLTLSADQQEIFDKIIKWATTKNDYQYVTLGGYAGTGKTTLTAVIRRELKRQKPDIKVAFCSFTGKATRVLENKLKELDAYYSTDSISTIHGLIYSPIESDAGQIIGWEQKKEIEQDFLIVDEASMVSYDIWRDLLSYGKKILAVGDHGQLPPINGSFNLMEKPMLRLEKIHRQAEGNPIIQLSIQARTLGNIDFGDYGNGIIKLSKQDSYANDLMEEIAYTDFSDTLILCGYNKTRQILNKGIRNKNERYTIFPVQGDRVICLKNNHEKRIYNGMQGTVDYADDYDDKWLNAKITFDEDNETFLGLIAKDQFSNESALNFTKDRAKYLEGDLFDYGYALTVHKAQGSQARRVILFEERFKQMDDLDWKRWLYTAVTRAKDELFIFS